MILLVVVLQSRYRRSSAYKMLVMQRDRKLCVFPSDMRLEEKAFRLCCYPICKKEKDRMSDADRLSDRSV